MQREGGFTHGSSVTHGPDMLDSAINSPNIERPSVEGDAVVDNGGESDAPAD